MRKPIMYIDITGPDGNMHFILARVREILQKARRITEYNNLRDLVYQGNYYQGLYRINKVITMIDTSEDQILEGFIEKGKIMCKEVEDA